MYHEMKDFLVGELSNAKLEYETAKMDVNKLEALQGISNIMTLLQQTETLINAELVNAPVVGVTEE
jgi:hypothetical protein